MAGFETSSRPYLLNDGTPRLPDFTVRRSFENWKVHGDFSFTTSFLVSSSHETLVEENGWFLRGVIVEPVTEVIPL